MKYVTFETHKKKKKKKTVYIKWFMILALLNHEERSRSWELERYSIEKLPKHISTKNW